MKFEFIGNACGIFHGSKGTRLLCDPWIVDGILEGSWCHYPPLKTTLDEVLDVDVLYVSHIHQDHYDERYFNFRKDIPIIVLDSKYNFLINSLERKGYTNLIRVKDNETINVKEFEITLYAPYCKNNFHESVIGNLLDSAMVVQDNNITAINFNDNTPTVESCSMLREKFGKIDLAMINYNAAGPYPACFDNLTEAEKIKESDKILVRNYDYMVALVNELRPSYVLPFAGAYVIGGKLFYKNKYLGTDTWDACQAYISDKVNKSIDVVCLRDKDVFDLTTGKANNEYVPIDENHMNNYIENELSQMKYPYEDDDEPDIEILLKDIKLATSAMQQRMSKFKIELNTTLSLIVNGKEIILYSSPTERQKLSCKMDNRILRRILNRDTFWNTIESGLHVDYNRVPNVYEFDAHTALQFFHL